MDLAQVAARLLQYAAASAVGGTALYFVYGWRPTSRRWPGRLVRWGAGLGVIATAGWLVAKTAELADTPAGAFDPAMLWAVAGGTEFGRAALVRLGLFAVALMVSLVRRDAWRPLAWLGLAAAASFAWTGHGASDEGTAGLIHLGADALHAVSAAVWLGGLAALTGVLVDTRRTATEAADALDAFSRVGVAVVLTVLATGLVNSWFLVGLPGLGGLLTTRYGLALTIKIGLFGAMLILAGQNRWRHTPRLRTALAQPGDAIAETAVSVVIEALAALVILGLVAWLGTLPPLAHG